MLHIRRKGRGSIDPALIRLSIIPMVDVVLVLLLYFVMEGSLAPAEGKLSSALAAQRSGPGAGTTDMTAQVLRVDMVAGKTRYRIGGREMFTREDLASVLGALPKAPGIIVQVSDDAPVQAAATALQSARNAGFTKVSYVAGS
jgi:biopolymer transport protein ExbD